MRDQPLPQGSHEATAERETIDIGGTAVETITARPRGAAASHAVVVIPDIMGVRPLFDTLCRQLATHGLAVRAFEPFAEIPADERARLDVPARMQRVKELRDERILAWAAACAEGAEADVAQGTADRASIIGFCMGGYFCLKAAASGRFAAAVAFYGMIRTPEPWVGPGLREPLATIATARPTLAIFGGKDPWTPSADIEALRAAWARSPRHEIVVYLEAEHGFVHDPERPAHRPDDAADAWRRALRLIAPRVSSPRAPAK